MDKSFPHSLKLQTLRYIQEAQKPQTQVKKKNNIMTKSLKTNDEKQILKAAKGKQNVQIKQITQQRTI